MPAPAHTPSWLCEVYDPVEKAVNVASTLRQSMAESKLHVDNDPLTRLDFKGAALALAHTRRDANTALLEAEIPLRANAVGVWEACRAALEGIEPINHACMHVLVDFGMNAGDHMVGGFGSCPAFEGCCGFTGNIRAYFAAAPSFNEVAILERMRDATIAVVASHSGANPMSGRPRSQAPCPQNPIALAFMIEWENALRTGASRYGQPEHYGLPAQGNTENDRAALKLLRACCTNYWEADQIVLSFLGAPSSFQRPILQRMKGITEAARLAAAHAALLDGPPAAAENPPQAPSASPPVKTTAPSVPAGSGPPKEDGAPADRDVKERMALAELLLIGPNASAIATRVGVKRTTLLGWPKFREHYDRAKKEVERRRQERRGRRAGERDFEGQEDE